LIWSARKSTSSYRYPFLSIKQSNGRPVIRYAITHLELTFQGWNQYGHCYISILFDHTHLSIHLKKIEHIYTYYSTKYTSNICISTLNGMNETILAYREILFQKSNGTFIYGPWLIQKNNSCSIPCLWTFIWIQFCNFLVHYT